MLLDHIISELIQDRHFKIEIKFNSQHLVLSAYSIDTIRNTVTVLGFESHRFLS